MVFLLADIGWWLFEQGARQVLLRGTALRRLLQPDKARVMPGW